MLKLKAVRRATLHAVGLATLSALVAPQSAAALSPPSVTAVNGDIPEGFFSADRRRDVLQAQLLLDRAHFSPGVIDGFMGGNTARAVSAWQEAHGLSPDGKIDADLLAKLGGSEAETFFQPYQLTEQDVSGPFAALPSGMIALSKVESTYFESLSEKIAEKFHMSQATLRALNPGIDQAGKGTTILVAAIKSDTIPKVARIEVDGAEARVRAFGQNGELVATFPATVGSAEFPSPSGSMKVRAIAPDPIFYFSPEGRSWGPDKKLQIAAGPNNPVGSTWIDLTKEGYGIHGTPDPRLIGKTASHGCVRLTNWDAEALADAVSAGVEVEFV